MGMWHCDTVRISEIRNHDNADNLEIAKVWDYNVVIKKGQYKVGDLVSYISVNTVCGNHPEFTFLGKDAYKRLKAKRLRQVYSEGLLVSAPPGFEEGQSVVEYYGLQQYIPPEEAAERIKIGPDGLAVNGNNGQNEKAPEGWSIPYFDIESLKKYSNLFIDKEVSVSTKIHGEHIDFVFQDNKLYVKSRNFYKKKDENSRWWEVALRDNYEEKFSKFPGKVALGECYGNVKGFRYDCPIIDNKVQRKVRIFDVYDLETKKFLEQDYVLDFCDKIGVEPVPQLYRGKFDKEYIYSLANQPETLGKNFDDIREGIVCRATPEQNVHNFGRLIAKLHSEKFCMI